jgi:carboxylesterase
MANDESNGDSRGSRRRVQIGRLALSAWDLERSGDRHAKDGRVRVIALRSRQRLAAAFEAEREVPRDNRSFYLVGKQSADACLLIHGAQSSPAAFRSLGRFLHRGGLTVHALLLPGHGSEEDTPADVRWRASLQRARQSFRHLRRFNRRVHVVGMSFGTVLAIQLARTEPVASLALLAPALVPRVSSAQRLALELKLYRLPWIRRWLSWNADLIEGMDAARGAVSGLNIPVFAAQCEDDERIAPVSLRILQKKARHPASRFQLYPSGGHAVLASHGEQGLDRAILNFFKDRR